MKWAYLLGVLILAPALAVLLRSNRKYIVPICFWLGLSMLLLAPTLWTALYSWPLWPSPVKGTEVSFVDAFSIALFFSSARTRIPLSIKIAYAIIWVALIISTSVAYNTIAAVFYLWEFLRATLLFIAVARVSAGEPQAPIALVAGLAVGAIGEAIWVPIQHVQGMGRPGGSLGYANILGIALDLIVLPVTSLILGSRRLTWAALVIPAAGACVLLGGSRASMGLLGGGLILTLMLSLVRKRTSRKFAFAAALALLCLASLPAFVWAASQRSDEDIASSDQQRAAMEDAAQMVIADYPLGVGANQYVVVANVGGYMARAGVAWGSGSRGVPVHDTYYLVAAEFGFLGLIGLFTLFGSLIVLGFRNVGCRTLDDAGELIPGLLAAFVIVAIHISFEFAFMEAVLHYLFAASAGMLVGIVAQSKQAVQHAPARAIATGTLSHAL